MTATRAHLRFLAASTRFGRKSSSLSAFLSTTARALPSVHARFAVLAACILARLTTSSALRSFAAHPLRRTEHTLSPVRPCVRSSVRPSVRPSVHLSALPASPQSALACAQHRADIARMYLMVLSRANEASAAFYAALKWRACVTVGAQLRSDREREHHAPPEATTVVRDGGCTASDHRVASAWRARGGGHHTPRRSPPRGRPHSIGAHRMPTRGPRERTRNLPAPRPAIRT
eukprot:CAMPEP_0185830912 /NCGR_PEP_ID=MMETSP1353-20130828/1158_1 /TAXON_ID=1077150 /ORGANISM="Erythrolobus australicus, Strain CCMP3124" /LENGTH=231 /DNA_ID=CAMNT_0028528907 /DNA_START=699 /DNA_END=1390 /DNA_ORIENTATION=-